MTDETALPLYYPGKSLADMETMLRRDYLTGSGWLESAEAKMALRGGEPLPWFTYGAISFLEEALGPDLALFEYGGGQSTLYWAARLRRVVSVDHDPAFGDHLRASLPANAEFRIVPEGADLSPDLARRAAGHPVLPDPERDMRTYRSGQLNTAFLTYAMQILTFPDNSFDVVVVDGMARVMSTWAAIRHFRRDGFIVFDNSDRDFYRPAYDMLADAGYRRIDFTGLGPVNPYEWGTSVFYQPRFFPGTRWFPKAPAAPEPRDRTGILVLGYNRPHHLQSVLESLRLQGRIGEAHVWIDGTQGRGEFLEANAGTVRLARRYAPRELRVMESHLGIEKMMLDALEAMTRLYQRVIVLEDDCFPLEGAIDAFETELDATATDPGIHSVYGHHFGTEPPGTRDFPRFQGWGWAAQSDRIRALLPDLRQLFLMNETEYRDHVAARLDAAMRARLDTTPGRDVLKVLGRFFSWDSATAFLTAARGLSHRRTARPAIVNTGITGNIGHFRQDLPHLRRPPFNMITLAEAWDRYDTTTPPCPGDADSYGLDGLDRLIRDALPPGLTGFFIEIGAHDGVTQSNSLLLEKAGWTGLLIEANPGAYARCRRARPGTLAAHCACVGADFQGSYTTITDVGLMSMTRESGFGAATRADWVRRGEGFAGRPAQDIEVPAITMSALLDRHGIRTVDLLLLDVEGAETEVLKGLDFTRHAPRFIVAEDAHDDAAGDFLRRQGYRRTAILLERAFTRDCLYSR